MTRSVYRMLDANLNRAREGARVVEDYARFVLDHSGFSKTCKNIRHELQSLARLIERSVDSPLAEFRDTRGDVGTRIGHESERRRDSALDVAVANLKRLEESLRVLEEQSKCFSPEIGAGFERLRYRVYTLEKQFLRVAAKAARDTRDVRAKAPRFLKTRPRR